MLNARHKKLLIPILLAILAGVVYSEYSAINEAIPAPAARARRAVPGDVQLRRVERNRTSSVSNPLPQVEVQGIGEKKSFPSTRRACSEVRVTQIGRSDCRTKRRRYKIDACFGFGADVCSAKIELTSYLQKQDWMGDDY